MMQTWTNGKRSKGGNTVTMVTVAGINSSAASHPAECLHLLCGLRCPGMLSSSHKLLPMISCLTFLFLYSSCPRFGLPKVLNPCLRLCSLRNPAKTFLRRNTNTKNLPVQQNTSKKVYHSVCSKCIAVIPYSTGARQAM